MKYDVEEEFVKKIIFQPDKFFGNTSSLRFYPKHGFCLQLSDYPINLKLTIDFTALNKSLIDKVETFVTDAKLATTAAINEETHKEAVMRIVFTRQGIAKRVKVLAISVKQFSQIDPRLN